MMDQKDIKIETTNIKQYTVFLKKQVLSFDERNDVIANAIALMLDENENYNPMKKQSSILLAVFNGYLLVKNEDGNEMDILSGEYKMENIYPIIYETNAIKLLKEVNQDQITEIVNTINDYINYLHLQTNITNNRTSKYDDVLDKIVEFINVYIKVFDETDVTKLSKDLSLLTKKLENVKEKDLVKAIIEHMGKYNHDANIIPKENE